MNRYYSHWMKKDDTWNNENTRALTHPPVLCPICQYGCPRSLLTYVTYIQIPGLMVNRKIWTGLTQPILYPRPLTWEWIMFWMITIPQIPTISRHSTDPDNIISMLLGRAWLYGYFLMKTVMFWFVMYFMPAMEMEQTVILLVPTLSEGIGSLDRTCNGPKWCMLF